MTDTDVSSRWQLAAQAESYDAMRFRGVLGHFFEKRQRRALRRCLKRIGPVETLADLPCGTGRMLPLLGQHATSVVACDVSEAMMQHAVRRMAGSGNIRYLLCDARSVPLGDGSVDAVVSVRFFMHLTPDQRAAILCEFARVSRRWVIVEYGCDSAWHRVRRALRSVLFRLVRHQRIYPGRASTDAIRQEAQRSQLAVRDRFWTLRGLSESAFILMEKTALPICTGATPVPERVTDITEVLCKL
jgi:ubiquinone/menaquinone biosynthesis C-methylase UbiE